MNSKSTQIRSRQHGVTLMELLIVVVIVGLLAAVALPSYRENAMRAARSDARTALQEALSRQEQFFLDNRTYTNSLAALNLAAATENDYYTVSIDAATAGCPISRCYTMRAVPQGRQADDTQCAALTINSSGTKSATGTEPASCW
jgi:type IV pilus assembly protein PilE